MRVVLTKKRVVGHVMRYPGEVVEVPDTAGVPDEGPSTAGAPAAPSAQDGLPTAAEPEADEVGVPAPLRRRKKTAARREVGL